MIETPRLPPYRMARCRYENPVTGVYFFIRLRSARSLLFRRTVAYAEFEINYFRPSFFGIEAEIELSALIAAFRPQIFDPQMHGMAEGPYSGEGFLKGWNFGNLFSTRNFLSRSPDSKAWTMPQDKLRAAWLWNYHNPERSKKLANRRFCPMIQFHAVDGRASTVAVWPRGMPVSLPKVDHVLIGRFVAGEKRYGLASWAEVVDVAQSARFDISKEPLDMEYFITPPSIAKWVAEIPLIADDVLERLEVYQIHDDEVMEAAAALEIVE